ncbi:hypothetical protein [Geobacter sp. AOG2]|uniref:hypothetical protein n=1 Tax=Geobacter sp. AOG2 TaxID=1566347 RepID=UPI001CC40C26|nr:hypothetical protein [Geobacter sp. AOG2]GFE59856.1 hypothetical protein AOG2_04440 [Geobacter sp. AOG2]
MVCEIFKCCKFFNDAMPEMPQAADYIKNKYCFGDNSSCARYRAYKELGGDDTMPAPPLSLGTDEIKKIMQCMKSRNLPDDAATLRSLLNDYLNDDH